jgi:hypothetical protein
MLRSVSNLNTFIDSLTQDVYLSSVFWVLVNIGMSINQMLFFMAQQTKAGQGHFIIQASTSHVMAQYIQKCSSGRKIAQSQRRLPNNTQHSRERERERERERDMFLPPAVFESDLPQTLALDRSTTGVIQIPNIIFLIINSK